MADKKYLRYLHSPQWAKIKAKVIERSKGDEPDKYPLGKCEKCGYQPWKPESLQVHHLDYSFKYHEMDNLDCLILLCTNCHKAAHGK
jgi:5-methylcytosine-specific restriction endonuclease McrA